MERWRPAGPWSDLHSATEKAANGTTVTQITTDSEAGSMCVRLRFAVFYCTIRHGPAANMLDSRHFFGTKSNGVGASAGFLNA
jgi:hypothetical protein